MYRNIDGTLVITVNDWCAAGLTYKQYNHDNSNGLLKIFRRGINGNTLIDVRSIQRPERIDVLERAYGEIGVEGVRSIFEVEIDTEARDYFVSYRKGDGSPLEPDQIKWYTNEASIFEALKRGLEKQRMARARVGKRVKMGEFWQLAVDWFIEQTVSWPIGRERTIGNARSLERAFKRYLNGGYGSLIHGNTGNDSARVVSARMEQLFIAIWSMNGKPFITEVHQLYLEFVSGNKELYDSETGEIFNPADFRHKGRALEVSEATIWNYLKDIVNNTANYAVRNGNFDYVNKMRPKHKRKLGRFSLSKISMDDVVLSRKSVRGWVTKYIAVDVVSGYWFRPAYVVGKPSINTVVESFRNMFCELAELGLPMPGELEVENHLMKDIAWLDELFPFVRFCTSPTEKRAEHKIREFKYGASKRAGHTRGRWYAKHEAYRSVRNKVSGDFIEPEYQPQAIIADDLQDIETHNNELHPLQKTYPKMTRKEVFLANINPELKAIDEWHLYRFIGNETDTSVYNNDYCPVQGEKFELMNFDSLKRLASNNYNVTAYWLPEEDGSINKAYLYQGEKYIGEAMNSSMLAYNENKIEQTADDAAKILAQQKRIAKFDKIVKERRREIPKVGVNSLNTTPNPLKGAKSVANWSAEQEVRIVETEQPRGYDGDDYLTELENMDWAARAVADL